nr:PREDICTED: uncharacterized protein LOC109034722 [Bemisia tabaci]
MEIDQFEECAKSGLVCAIHEGKLSDVQGLLPLANLSKQEEFYCLFNSLFYDHHGITSLFLKNGFEFVNPEKRSCPSVFRLTVFNPNIELIDMLLKNPPQNDQNIDEPQISPLLLLAFRGGANKRFVSFFESLLCKPGADLAYLLDSPLLPPSFPAGRQPALTLRTFLEYSSAVMRLSDFSSLLYLAFSRGNERIVKLLLSRIVADDLVDLLETILTESAFDEWRPELFRIILEYGSTDMRIVPENHVRALFENLNRCTVHFPHVHLISNCIMGRMFNERGTSTTEVLIQHAIKMKVAGFYRQQLVMVLFHDPEMVTDFRRKCESELADMRRECVGDSGATYFDVLTTDLNRLALLAANDRIAGILTSNYVQERFPIYGGMLRYQFEKGMVRNELLKESIDTCYSSFSYFANLPYELVETILGYVDNTTLRVLVYPREAGMQNVFLTKNHQFSVEFS